MMKFFHKAHLWLSIPFGIIITLICFSGAMLVLEPEITRSIKSDVYYVASSKGTPLSMEVLMETVKKTLPDSVSIKGVTVFADKERTYQVNLSKPHHTFVFIDQYSGKITGRNEHLAFFSTMLKMHRKLLFNSSPKSDGVKTGKLLVGISTLIFVITLVTGVVIWWQRARKNFRHSLSISFKDGWRGLWRCLHVAGGMYVLVFVLAMALTGLTWSFHWYRSAFYAVCGVESTPGNSASSKSSKGDGYENRRDSARHEHSEFRLWQKVYDELSAQNPDAPQITISPENALVAIGTMGNTRASDKYEYNRLTGEIISLTPYAQSDKADKLRGWVYSIHKGIFGGITTRILWFLAALFGASLPLTGYYIWIKRLIRGRQSSEVNRL